jgi:hypothetical protein
MPYILKKYKGLYKVQNKNTKKYYSDEWIPYETAMKQLRLLQRATLASPSLKY